MILSKILPNLDVSCEFLALSMGFSDDETNSQHPTPTSRQIKTLKRKNSTPSKISGLKKKLFMETHININGMDTSVPVPVPLDPEAELSDRQLLLLLLKDSQDVKMKLDQTILLVSAWEEKYKELEKTCKYQQKTIDSQNRRLQIVERAVDDLYCKQNENNVIVKGISHINVAHRAMQEIFQDVEAPKAPSIVSINPLGKSRKLLFKFNHAEDKHILYKNSKYLSRQGIEMEDDLPPNLRSIRNNLLIHRRELLDNGTAKHVKVLRRSLLIDGKDMYDYNESTNSMEPRKQNRKSGPARNQMI